MELLVQDIQFLDLDNRCGSTNLRNPKNFCFTWEKDDENTELLLIKCFEEDGVVNFEVEEVSDNLYKLIRCVA